MLESLYNVLLDRKINPRKDSYTSSLLYHKKGINKILEKVAEECIEVILAAKNENKKEVIEETADLFYHVLVLLVKLDIKLEEVWDELEKRRKNKNVRNLDG